MTGTRAYAGHVLHVVDGDTVKLAIRLRRSRGRDTDLGFHVYREAGWLTLHETFRLDGLNCPEHGTPAGEAATAYVEGILPIGSHVTALVRQVAGHDAQERYGRWLAEVRPDGRGDESVNQLLLAAGLALPWDGHGPRPV